MRRRNKAFTKEFALYKGEELLAIGSIEEIAEKMNVKPRTIEHYYYDSYNKKIKNPRQLILLDD